ncbi:MAG: SipW-dependent-type signal peptide-containing protein [Dethiobacter sp.]|jgi:predicted ribosomally synthesized peptide with SipW-like signal peptide|nr:SipW-dependent-type signal peptide-containing protein [Dethiobacter sp.]MBS3989187.1 SipW-dependent-type signal peptide-containing protein [Dethiobacter sp.]
MKKKMFMSMLVIALAAALVGGATMAIFTDTETSAGNSFAAGTVDITVGSTVIPEVGFANMAPGDIRSGSFTVTNAGTLALRFDVLAATSGALFEVQGNSPGNTPAVVGGLTDDQDVVLAPGASATVTFTVTLPLTAGNEYQNDNGTVTFTVNAEQTANN